MKSSGRPGSGSPRQDPNLHMSMSICGTVFCVYLSIYLSIYIIYIYTYAICNMYNMRANGCVGQSTHFYAGYPALPAQSFGF